MSNFFRSNFFIKLTSWEYWPFGIIQTPLFFMWMWYALKERSLFHFSASNPTILTGGMMGESKYEVLKLVPDEVKPKTTFVSVPTSVETVLELLQQNGFTFPVIFKPDMGERGWMVRRIKDKKGVEAYLKEIKIDFLIQALIDLPLEFGVFYVRFPSQQNGFVNSITGKEFLTITGDGKKTLLQLIFEKDRALIQWNVLRTEYADRLEEIIEAGKKVELVSIGNHCLGTTFLNCNHLITPKLNHSFNELSKRINGFYFGRFDLRCASVNDLQNGNIKIMELNGCGAEPSHIYHPGSSLFKAIGILIEHGQNLYRVSKENHERGVPYLSWKEGNQIYKRVKKQMAPQV